MEKYIVLTEFGEQQDIRVETIFCKNKYNLLLCWAKRLSYPRIGAKSKKKLIEEIKFDLQEFRQYVMNVMKNLNNIYSESYIVNGIFIELYVIKVLEIAKPINSYAIIVFFKNTDFMYEKYYKTPLEALLSWSRQLLPWQYYSKEEKNEIRKIVQSIKKPNCIIRNLVWNFECSIFGNKLKVYIVKS